MATRYWVGGTGDWDNTTTHWSASSGGSSGASVPTQYDDVIFDANSNTGTGSFTVNGTGFYTPTCRNFTASGLDGAMTFNIMYHLLYCYGSMSIPASNFTLSDNAGIWFYGASGTLTTNGTTLGNAYLHFEGSGSWSLSGSLTCGNIGMNGYSGTISSFNFNNNNVTASGGISLPDAGSVSITGLGGTFSAGSVFRGGGRTFATLNLTDGNGSIEGANTFTTVNVSGMTNKINNIYIYANQTIGTLSVSGAASNKYVIFQAPSAATLTVGTLSGSDPYTGWKNITLAGAASPKTFGFGVWDFGGNSGMTFNTGSGYWIGGTGSWSEGSHWSTTSGGSGGGGLPGPQNNVVFDASSNTGTSAFTTTVDYGYYCKGLNAASIDGAMSLVVSSGYTFNVASDWSTPSSNFSFTLNPSAILCFSATSGTQSINSHGVTFDTASGTTVQFNYPSASGSATYALSANFACTGKVTLYAGTLNLAGYSLTCDSFNVTEGTYSKALTWNGGTLSMSASTYPFNTYNGTSYFTTSAGSGAGTMRFTAAGATVSSIYPYTGFTYNATLSLDGANSTYELSVGDCTANGLVNTAYPITVKFTPTGTHYFNSFGLAGSAGSLVTLSTLTGTSAYTLSKTSGSVNVSYCTISRSVATGGATWNAYTVNGNIDGGNNTGWVFVSPYSGNFFFGSNF